MAKRTTKQRIFLSAGVATTAVCVIGMSVAGWLYYRVETRPTFNVSSLDKKQTPLPTLVPRSAPTTEPPTMTSTSQPKPGVTTTTAAPRFIPPAPLVPPRSLTDGTNFLLVGIDSASGMGGDAVANGRGDSANTDTMMILRVDNTTNQISLVSVPRDMFVQIAGTNNFDRINAAREYKNGRARLTSTIRDTLGIEIHHYIEVNFRAFKSIVDAIGGVPMNFKTHMIDWSTGFDVPGGCSMLNGTLALAYVRSRHMEVMGPDGQYHADLSADYGRVVRQQAFLMNMGRKAMYDGLDSPVSALKIFATFTSDVGTSDSLSTDDLIGFANRMASIGLDNVHTYSLPVDGVRTLAGQDVLLLKLDAATPILNIFRGQWLPGDALPTGSGARHPGPLGELPVATTQPPVNTTAVATTAPDATTTSTDVVSTVPTTAVPPSPAPSC